MAPPGGVGPFSPPPPRCGHGGAAGVSRPPQPVRAGPGPGCPRFGTQRDRLARGAAGRRPLPDGVEFRLVQLQVSARHHRAGEKLRGCDASAVPVSNGAGGEGPVLLTPPPPGPTGAGPDRPRPLLCAEGLRCGVIRPAAAATRLPGNKEGALWHLGRVTGPCPAVLSVQGVRVSTGGSLRAPVTGLGAIIPSRLNLGLLGLFS